MKVRIDELFLMESIVKTGIAGRKEF